MCKILAFLKQTTEKKHVLASENSTFFGAKSILCNAYGLYCLIQSTKVLFLCSYPKYLYIQVTTLVSSKSPVKKKGKSKRAHVLVAAVERATANFVERGDYCCGKKSFFYYLFWITHPTRQLGALSKRDALWISYYLPL